MIGTNPGELVLHSLLKQFASICQYKVENAIDEKAVSEFSRKLQCLLLKGQRDVLICCYVRATI